MPEKRKSQSDRFKEAARELGADGPEKDFNEALRAIGKHKPPDEPKTDDEDDKPGQ